MIKHSNLGFTSTSKPTPAQIPVLRIGVEGGAVGSWDEVIATSGFANWYKGGSLEHLMEPLYGWSGEYDDLDPVLATSWTLFNWPNEMNYHPTDPFINEGGLMAIELTLREGVTFHDGSAWNATVAKWNIDRNMVMTGNITGSITAFDIGVTKARTSYWSMAEDWKDYETDTWNVSQYIGQPGTYEGFGTSTDADMIGRYCKIKNVTITNDLPSGGKIRINFADWGGANSALLNVYSLPMISMDAYIDYFDVPIYGLGDVPGFPQPDISGGYPSTGFPGHLIGTGPYIFIEQDELILQGGSMKINPNWWNSTAMQAQGWHKVPEISVVYFRSDDLTARNLAMVTGTIDLAYDSEYYGSLIYQEMINAPNVKYMELGYEATRTFITLNCINETYWKTWADLGPGNYPAEIQARANDYYDMDSDGTIHVDGIDRTLRKALSYAFDYDTFITTILQGRAVRSGGFLGVENEFYNPSIPIAYRDLTIARQALIDDPYWEPLVTARQLDINNATADWIWVADNDPIFEFKLLWEDSTIPQADLFSTNIKDIGIKLATGDGKRDPLLNMQPNLYNVMIMRIDEFPAFSYHGVPTNWPDANIGNIPVIEYFYKSPGLPYKNGSGLAWPGINYLGGQFFNIGFHYNATVDDWMERAWFSDRTTLQEIMNNMTRHFQTYQYSDIFISHSQWGFAIDKEWEHSYYRGTSFQFLKYTPSPPPPGDIALSSDAGTPDIDGNFNLIWNVSIGADNYSIYRSSSLITEINGSLTLIAEHNATSPYLITGLSDGTYYFIVVAHNQHGDTLSNNINITVQKAPILPSSFILNSDADVPDDDGFFNLSWTSSNGADNYSIYMHTNMITEINGSLTIIANQTATSPHLISGLTDGEYYFVAVAYNQYGNTMSNNVHITVLIPPPPSSFVLSSDADFPDDDGSFDLSWTSSNGADNYSLFMSNNPINTIDSSLTTLLDQTALSPFPVLGLPNGEYYFVVVAHNQYGDTLSNNVHVTVNILGGPTAPAISGYNALVLLGIAICTAVILFKKINEKFKR